MKRYFINGETAACIAAWSGFALLVFFLVSHQEQCGKLGGTASGCGSFRCQHSLLASLFNWVIIMFQVVLGMAREEHKKDKMTWHELQKYEERK